MEEESRFGKMEVDLMGTGKKAGQWVEVDLSMQIEMSMKANGLKIWHKDMVSISTGTGLVTKVIGKMICKKDMVVKSGLMVLYMKDNTYKERNMAKVLLNGLKRVFTLGTSKITKYKGLVGTSGMMEGYMKDSGK